LGGRLKSEQGYNTIGYTIGLCCEHFQAVKLLVCLVCSRRVLRLFTEHSRCQQVQKTGERATVSEQRSREWSEDRL